MKLSHAMTYHCDECGRYAYPDDIYIDAPDQEGIWWDTERESAIFVVYSCACGLRTKEVVHEIDDNGELFPFYKLSGGV